MSEWGIVFSAEHMGYRLNIGTELDAIAQRKRERRLLRDLAEQRCRRRDVLARIEALVGSAIGAPVRHLSGDPIVSPRVNLAGYIKTGRTHTRHELRLCGSPDPRWEPFVRRGRIVAFVKMCADLKPSVLDDTLNGLSSPDFTTPYAFGVCSDAEVSIGAWSYSEGERRPFAELSPEMQARLVRAVAGVNGVRSNGLRFRTRWLHSSIDHIDHHYSALAPTARDRWAATHERVVKHYRRKKRINAAINEAPPVLAHNDFNANNVFAPADGPICVYDWEKASLSVPGADLGFLAPMPQRDGLLSCYVERMGELGFRLDPERVSRALLVIEGSRLIKRGWGIRNIETVEQGLGLVELCA